MDLRKLDPGAASQSKASIAAIFVLLTMILAAAHFDAGCAAPGQPITRRTPAPTPVTDLSAQQVGNQVALTFTLPQETAQGRPLAKIPQVKIYREYFPVPAANGGGAKIQPPRFLLVTLPSQMIDQYRDGARIHFSDHLTASDFSAHAGSTAVYMVRTRVSRRDSADSNLVAIQLLPAPQPVQDLRAQVTKSAIALSWTPSVFPSTPALWPISIHYRVYRSTNIVNSPASAAASGETPQNTAGIAGSLPFGLIAETASPSYNDTNFKFGVTYAYEVNVVAQYESGSVESEYSNTIEVTPRDTFRPAPPTGLVAVAVPARGSQPAGIDLSWAISSEGDLAGYNVYRSDAKTDLGNSWDRCNRSLLPTPTFRDISTVSGKRYFYRVTAIDRLGNESAPSAAVVIDVPAKNE